MITALAILTCALSMTASALLAVGRLRAVYAIGVVNGLCYVALNVVLSCSEGQSSLALLVIPSLWGTAASAYGIRRLIRESKG